MNRDEMIEAAGRLSKRLREIAENIRNRSIDGEYHINSGELASLEGIADALNLFDEGEKRDVQSSEI